MKQGNELYFKLNNKVSFLSLYLNMSQIKKKYPRISKANMVMTQGPTKAKIKVRLDERTTVTIQHISALKLWQVKYPDAKVIETKVA